MESVKNLIDALNNGDNIEASSVFASIMNAKINDALDDKKIEIAHGMAGLKNNTEESVNEDDDNVQTISDEESE